ncbi:hypothetical protein RUM44_007641 [Polyplax serrata]|uniref:Uncharacterized protein n=1 Tax=Polyplax serrata TaxID=468196 RepID=A0ABR1B736_POLSC
MTAWWLRCFFLLPHLLHLGQQSQLFDLLSTADRYLDEFQTTGNLDIDLDNMKMMVRRTYQLDGFDLNDHKLVKRSTVQEETWIRDGKGE